MGRYHQAVKQSITRAGAWGALLGLLLVLAAGCAGRMEPARDLALPPQDALALLARTPGADWRLGPAARAALAADYRRRHLACWQRPDTAFKAAEVEELAAKVEQEPGYGPDFRRHSAAWLKSIKARMDLASYPNQGWPGISVAPAHLRVLPTNEPDFSAPPHELGGWPFDRLQQSSLPPDTPLWVHHASPVGDWLWVESPVAWGWLPAGRVARLEPDQVAAWQKPAWAVVTRDDTPLGALGGGFLHRAPLGLVLPLLGRDAESFTVLAAARSADGGGLLVPARLPRGAGAPWPLELSPEGMAGLAQNLLGQPYGWGGLFGWRDCSATLRDLMAPFGLWLPRNSGDQAQAGARFIELAELSPREKEERIQALGVPWLSLLWLPGHIMLYVGAPQGQALVLHSAWGLKTWRPFIGEGRALIARTVITSLEPGKELADRQGSLLERVEGLVPLVPPARLER